MAEDWQELLDLDATKAVRPPPLPKGTYRAFVKEQKNVRSAQKDTPGIEFTFSKLEPMSDVNSVKWTEYMQHPAIVGSEIERTDTFWLTRKALPRLREFCEMCGAKPEGTVGKMVTDAVNTTVLLSIEQRVAKDGKTEFDEISGYSIDKR